MNKNCFGKMHYCLLVILISLSSMLAMSQSYYNTTDWKFSNPQQFGNLVYDIDMFDNNVGLAVGANGLIARTTDGGSNWTYGPFSFKTNVTTNPIGSTVAPDVFVSPTFNDVHFVSANVAYAVGNAGVMAKTTDGGVTWSLIKSPLYYNAREINAVWFINDNTGYIGGQWNTADSIPKLYVTNNGGATWDSMNAPIGGKTRVGYIANNQLPPLIWDVTAKAKVITKIIFTSPTIGYICGSSSSDFPSLPGAPSNSSSFTTPSCPAPIAGATTSTSAHSAPLLWKFSNGVLIDYSFSKERLGYDGITTTTINCSTRYGQITPQQQTYRAMNVFNDSLVVLVSQNNNIVVRVYTGRLDSTLNVATGLKERGRYEIMSYPFPPNGAPPIPNPNNNLFSQPWHLIKAANGKLFAPIGSSVFNPTNQMYTSVDTGRNWVIERNLPTGTNYSNSNMQALDITPGGKFVCGGQNGVISDSIPGGKWRSNYRIQVFGTYEAFEFADCNNGIASGGTGNIAVTRDGGKNWIDRSRSDFTALNIAINGHAYVPNNPAKVYFTSSVGTIFKSIDTAITLDPVFADANYQMWDVATQGADSVWACGYSAFSVPTANRTPVVLRSTNGGVTWTPYTTNFFPGTNFQNFRHIEFPTRLIGYVSGTRDTVWKTTDGGVTWNKLPLPTPGVTPQITYKDMFALDANTVFLVGDGFPRKVVFKTTDGGNTWQEITGNILTIMPISNLNSVLFHDANNGYVGANGALLVTNNGGVSWTLNISPSGSNFTAIGFAPKNVTVPVSFQNRKLFLAGLLGASHILEFGNPVNINVNTSETVIPANCTNLTAGSIVVNTTGGISPYTYSINGGLFQASNTFSGLTQGVKTITVKDSYCGTLTKQVTVGFSDNLTIATIPAVDTLVCAGLPVPMLASTNGTGATYAWSPAGGLSAANIFNPTATVNSGNTVYTVTASLNGCVRSKTVNVRTRPNPIISAGPDKTIVDGDVFMLEGSGIDSPTFLGWTPAGTLTGASTYTPMAKPNTTTTYTLTVRDNNNCTSTDNMVLTVLPYCLKVMDAFTPNGDGQNDRWIVTNNGGTCSKRVYVKLFNRYGNLVYQNDNYLNNWDGMYNGKPVPDGTYYYVNTYELINGIKISIKGDVTILR
jgi:gliding motility-associated-like protein